MGQIRETRFPQTQSRNPSGWPVRLLFSAYTARSHVYARSQLESQQYQPALTLIDNLLTELKRLDDKMILTEVHLLESRVYRGIGNLPKAKVRPHSVSFNALS